MKNDELEKAAKQVIEKLEAWSEYHSKKAQIMTDENDASIETNKSKNYIALVNILKKALEKKGGE